jgi:hypothetical protein
MSLRIIIALFAFSLEAQAQSFQNLNFELANPGPHSGDPPSAANVLVTSALPYWSVFYGSVQQSFINVNAPSLGSTAVTLIAPGGGPIDGNYSVLLQGGITASVASISQTGLIPSGTQSLFFDAEMGAGSYELLIGNQAIPFTAVGGGSDYTLYGANISAWADQKEELTFSALENGNSYWIIDDISFSQTELTPEPSPLILTGIGGLIFALDRRFRQR